MHDGCSLREREGERGGGGGGGGGEGGLIINLFHNTSPPLKLTSTACFGFSKAAPSVGPTCTNANSHNILLTPSWILPCIINRSMPS